MCHSTGLKQQSEQIEKFVENGMPQKVIKNVNFIINRKKKLENRNKNETEKTFHKTKHEAAQLSTTSPSLPTTKAVTYLTCPFTANKAIISTRILTNNNNQRQSLHKDHSKNQILNLNGNIENNQIKENVEQIEKYVDALTVGTQWTKQFAEHLNQTIQKLQTSKLYSVMTRTTQPAHLIAFLTMTLVLLIVGPDLIEYSNIKSNGSKNSQFVDGQAQVSMKNDGHNVLATVFYLGAFATHFGAQIWMTFVSGLALYFSLPRHIFGQCQQILFPKYFAFNGMLSIAMLVVYIKCFLHNWTLMDGLQIVGLALSAFIEVTVRLYLAPPMLKLMHEKYRIEDTVGSGNEIGNIEQGDLVECPHYQRIHKMFRRMHMTIAIGNITVLMCTCLNLYFLASKIKLS